MPEAGIKNEGGASDDSDFSDASLSIRAGHATVVVGGGAEVEQEAYAEVRCP
jgi:hypothetical protein